MQDKSVDRRLGEIAARKYLAKKEMIRHGKEAAFWIALTVVSSFAAGALAVIEWYRG
jgi:hypothetical protein